MQMPPEMITLPYKFERKAEQFIDDDNRYPESLVRYFLNRYTQEKDKVFDPFVGLGTTMFVCEELNRIPYGIEADRKRYEWTAAQLEHFTHIFWEDSAKMQSLGLPKMDFAITSPPFMARHHKWNPLYGGDPDHAGYNKYLKRMSFIFKKLSFVLKRNAQLVLQLDNIHGKSFTPLIRDLGLEAAKSFRQDDEIIIRWQGGADDYPYTHCLIFKNTQK